MEKNKLSIEAMRKKQFNMEPVKPPENSAYYPTLHRYLCVDLLPGLDRIISSYENELMFAMNRLRDSIKSVDSDKEADLYVYSGLSDNLCQRVVSLRDDLRLAIKGRFRCKRVIRNK